MDKLEDRVKAIEVRNEQVEKDKAWETSWFRRMCIAVLTYIVVVIYLLLIRNESPFINAIVPPVGFLLSTLVMRTARKNWEDWGE